MEKHCEQLSNIDKYFFLDLAFVSHCAGEGGQRKLEEILLAKCLPSSETYISVGEAVKESEKILECDLYNFSSEGAQGALKAAHQLLRQIQQGVTILSNRNGTNFLQQVFARSQYFVVFSEKHKIWFAGEKDAIEKAASDDLLRGSKALEAMWQIVQKKDPKDLNLKQLEPLVVFGQFLPEASRKVAHEKAERVMKLAHAKAGKASKAVPAESDAKPSKRKASSSATDARKAAKGLFGA